MNSNIEAESGDTLVRLIPYMLILFIGITWGMTFSFARIATEAGAHPIGLTFWQATGGGLVLLVISIFRRQFPVFNWQNIKRFLIIALAGTAFPGTLFFYAAAYVPAGILAITIALVPMLTYAIAWTIGIDKFQPGRFFGILLGFSAILLLTVPETSLPDRSMVAWLLLCLLAVVFYTIENIYIDVCIPQGTDLIALLTGSLFTAALIMTPVMFFQNAFVPLSYPFTSLEWSIISIALVSSLAYTAFLVVVKMSGSVFASMAGYMITLSGVFWGIVFFAESHSIWVWAALTLMLAGMALVTPREHLTK